MRVNVIKATTANAIKIIGVDKDDFDKEIKSTGMVDVDDLIVFTNDTFKEPGVRSVLNPTQTRKLQLVRDCILHADNFSL